MADAHVIQWTAAFVGALYLTSTWMVDRPQARWRHILAAAVAALFWIPVAYTAGNVGVVADDGTVVALGSDALATFSLFMVVVNVVGLLLGLLLWTEEEAEEVHESLPEDMQHRPRGD